MEHDPNTRVPVYHNQAPSDDSAERDAAGWVRFGLDVMAAHQPGSDGDTCQGCGRIWDCCPVVVAARQHGLGDHLTQTSARAGHLSATRTRGLGSTRTQGGPSTFRHG
jgi:hypothetical protein